MAQSTPLQFDVPDMDCESCVKSIRQAVERIDAAAHVYADLATKRVVIGGEGDIHDYMKAVEDAGFTVKAAA
jgi:copper chaperone CopZ